VPSRLEWVSTSPATSISSSEFDDLERGVVDRGQPLAELGPGAGLDPRDQQAQHVVEDLDLFFAETLPVIHEQVRHPPQGCDAFGGRSAVYRIFQFADDRKCRLWHHGGAACRLLSGFPPTIAIAPLHPG
jgi:hypothetical protein